MLRLDLFPTRCRRPHGIDLPWGVLVAGALLTPSSAPAQGTPDYELPPIEYSARTPSNRIDAVVARAAEIGEGLAPVEKLRWLLRETGVPVESQVLVFSKTSLQRDLIHPRRPRALYFSEDVYVGWVPGGLIELTVTDPHLGLVFYRVETRDQSPRLRVARDADCLSCHGGSMTRNWPGLMVRSVFPDERGEPITSAGSVLVGHDTPFDQRWGGWYVTGRHGEARHRGNVLARPAERGATLDVEAGANRVELDDLFDPSPYLRPDSDLVALMVLEHQVLMHNRLCEAGLRVRRWSHYQRQLQQELGEPLTEEPVGTALRVVLSETERVLDALLFRDEIRLPEGGIQGAGDFERAFAANRRADEAGRSLKDFDLRTRLFRWRCSYMVYSEAFDALPPELKRNVHLRLNEILTSAPAPDNHPHLPAAERQGIREILLATKPDFAAAVSSGTPSLRHATASSR